MWHCGVWPHVTGQYVTHVTSPVWPAWHVTPSMFCHVTTYSAVTRAWDTGNNCNEPVSSPKHNQKMSRREGSVLSFCVIWWPRGDINQKSLHYQKIIIKINVEMIVCYLAFCFMHFKISGSDNLLDIISYLKVSGLNFWTLGLKRHERLQLSSRLLLPLQQVGLKKLPYST